MRPLPWAVLGLLAITIPVRAAEDAKPDAAGVKFFEEKIRPVLVQHCYKCHAADSKTIKGGLVVDTRAGIRRGGESGPAVVPGDLDESLIVGALTHETFEMPPAGKLPDKVVADFKKWIELGAPDPRDGEAADVGGIDFEEGRKHWAFQPVRDPEVPEVAGGWAANEIDRFVLRKLKEQGLAPAPLADRRTLIRRLYFDIVGLPPTPEAIEAFVDDPDPNAYEKLVDELLASPAYGEKGARHWLDVVRYAESDGFRKDDYRPTVWRYRDYVVRSFNEDKPYDQFVREQLAGDEIAPDDPDAVVATGYLRHYLYEYNQRDCRTQWNDILTDVTNVTGEAFLAMGMGCARCHDHKFDPIPRTDYFRLRAFFEPMLPRDDVAPMTAAEREAYELALAAWKEKTKEIRDEIATIEKPYRERAAKIGIGKFPADVKEFMFGDPADWTPRERQLADLVNRQVVFEFDRIKIKDEHAKQIEQLKKSLAEFDDLKPRKPATALTVTDVGPESSPTMIPGDPKQRVIEPGFLEVLAPGPAEIHEIPTAPDSTGRRTALANWITDPENPLSTRVIVNRVWQYHLGRGIVETTSDFGHLGEDPTHPELLDWLTSRFVEEGWRLKPLHRRILLSATYRQSVRHPDAAAQQLEDPRNTMYWRARVRRLDAERIRDAVLAVTGKLDAKRGGPSVSATTPRRSIYTKQIRNTKDPFLNAFDLADGFNSTAKRDVTTTANQALLLANAPWVLARAADFQSRVSKETDGDEAFVERAYQLAYGRAPESDEREAALAFLAAQQDRITGDTERPNPVLAKWPASLGSAVRLKPGSPVQSLAVADDASLPSGDFTIEAVVQLDSLYQDATVRTIASQWTSSTQQPGWAFGVTSTKSKYQPRNLILQLVGRNAAGKLVYEVVASNLRPELGRPYYLSATVDVDDAGETGVTFRMRDLSKPDAEVQTARVKHTVVGGYRAKVPFVVGGRHEQKRHFWDGSVGEVRLSSRVLDDDELLLDHFVQRVTKDSVGSRGDRPEGVVGHWTFDDPTTFGQDSSGHDNHVRLNQPRTNVNTKARTDFCHVLLNSSEFLYVD